MNKLVFLDIDGVLNRYSYTGAPSTIASIEPILAGRLNKLLLFTDAKLIISSSWRYLMLNGHYDNQGFAHMLKTHGITAADVIGHTGEDLDRRGDQIRLWMKEQATRPKDYVILDDDSDGMEFFGHRYLQIDSRDGLQDNHVQRAFEILGKVHETCQS